MISTEGNRLRGTAGAAEWVRYLGGGRTLRRLSAAELDQVLEIAQSIDPEFAVTQAEDAVDDGGLGLRPFGMKLHINAKRAAMLLAAAIVDFKLGVPVASTSLAGTASSLKCVALLDNQDGTFCLYTKIEELNRAHVPFTAESLADQLAGQPCRLPNLECEHRTLATCGLRANRAEDLLSKMAGNGIDVHAL